MKNLFDEAMELDVDHTADCPSCGGDMSFDASTQKLVCQYCEREVNLEIENGDIDEYDFTHARQYADLDWGIKDRVLKCENCGGKTVIGSNEATQYCSYCGSQHIVIEDDALGMKPETLIPFKITHQQAEDKFKGWIKRKYMAPRDLRHTYLKQSIKGIYMPYWTYDADTYSSYSVNVGFKRIRRRDDKQEVYYEYYLKTGVRRIFFDDVLIYATENDLMKYIKKIEPFNMGELVKYKPEFLAGYYACKYTVDPETGFEEAKGCMYPEIRSDIVRTLPGDTYKNLSIGTTYNDIKFKHILLPIYFSSYTYKNKVYRFLINGQTGEVQGQSPISLVKASIIALLIIAALIIFYSIGKNQ